MDKILAAWNIKTLQEFVNISIQLRNNSKTLEDVEEYLKNPTRNYPKPKDEDSEGFIRKPIRLCPNCGGTLKIFSLNKVELEQNPEMKSKWECCKTCKTESCGYVEYIKETIEQIIGE
jgi:hypothetical protein